MIRINLAKPRIVLFTLPALNVIWYKLRRGGMKTIIETRNPKTWRSRLLRMMFINKDVDKRLRRIG